MLSTHTEQYHIKASAGQTGGYCILPGDPGRCEKIAKYFDMTIEEVFLFEEEVTE